MEFNIKGIKFTLEDLAVISLKDLKANTISKSHIFYLLGNQKKPILLLRAGDFVEQQFIEKYTEKGVQSFYHLPIVNNELLEKYKNFWTQFKNARRQSEQFELRDEMLKNIVDDFLRSKDECFLTWVIACFESYYFLPNEFVVDYQNQSMPLYTRALLISSLSCIMLLTSGHVDYLFIKDFYNLAIMMDFGLLSSSGVEYVLIKACELERSSPGAGLDYIKTNAVTQDDMERFKNHPVRSFNALSEHDTLFVYPEVLEIVKMHHENQDGSGFPAGYYYSGLSETETILILCDHIIPFDEFIFHQGDAEKILIKSFENIIELDPDQKLPVRKLMKQWNAFIDWYNTQEGKVVNE